MVYGLQFNNRSSRWAGVAARAQFISLESLLERSLGSHRARVMRFLVEAPAGTTSSGWTRPASGTGGKRGSPGQVPRLAECHRPLRLVLEVAALDIEAAAMPEVPDIEAAAKPVSVMDQVPDIEAAAKPEVPNFGAVKPEVPDVGAGAGRLEVARFPTRGSRSFCLRAP